MSNGLGDGAAAGVEDEVQAQLMLGGNFVEGSLGAVGVKWC